MGSGRWGLAAACVLALSTGVAAAAPQGPQSVAALAAELSPAVVNISSTHHAAAGQGLPLPKAPEGSDLQHLFDDANPSTGDDPLPENAESLGSGFIVRADGLVVTNNHVISGADDIEVYLTDGTRLPARVIGSDSKTDLAVLKVDARRSLPFVEFDDSDKAQVGDWVMAIGNPFGLGGTVTLGIVSARNRDIQSGPYDSFIQTDASINQGNSGGPLFDMNGKVVGINTAIIAEGGASLGIGFAIPSNQAQQVVDQLDRYGEMRRGWIGVGIQDVTDDIAASIGRPNAHGAMVTDVTKGGPSDGLLAEGDIILDFDGKPVDTMHDLPRLVAQTAIGKLVPVVVSHDGADETVKIKLGRLEDETEARPAHALAARQPPAAGPAKTLADAIGFSLAPIDAARRKAYALSDDAEGLVITAVRAGSDADEKGLAAGLVVTQANRHAVSRVADVQSALDDVRKAGRPALLFRVIDPSGQGRFIAVKIEG
ncbi:MAG TPA: Do family serine endopeptidase [Devosia sp.]|nr:Do family serine endopeptidase [Devosia sp.]